MILLSVETCVTNISFEAVHYTPVNGVPTLHGHTFRLTVCVRGGISDKGWVIDFGKLREIVEEVVDPFKYSLIMPLKDRDSISIKGNFKVKFALINAPVASGEYLGLELCRKVREKLAGSGVDILDVGLELWEGSDNYVKVSC